MPLRLRILLFFLQISGQSLDPVSMPSGLQSRRFKLYPNQCLENVSMPRRLWILGFFLGIFIQSLDNVGLPSGLPLPSRRPGQSSGASVAL